MVEVVSLGHLEARQSRVRVRRRRRREVGRRGRESLSSHKTTGSQSCRRPETPAGAPCHVLPPGVGTAPVEAVEHAAKAVAELGRHDVVQDGVDGGVDVEHHP